MNSPRILIVDDEPSVRFILERTLKSEAYEVESAVDGEEALGKLRQCHYDMILLDLHMRGVNGLRVLQAARDSDPDIVVIILTAHGSLESAVEALRLGAYDYLFKPAAPNAIRKRVAEGWKHRIIAIKRRKLLDNISNLKSLFNELEADDLPLAPSTDNRFIHSGRLTLDKHHRTVSLNDQVLELTTTEFDLLACLVLTAPEPLTPRALLNCALGYDGTDTEARDIVKWHIHHLRQKVEPDPLNPIYIRTIRYKGYMWSG